MRLSEWPLPLKLLAVLVAVALLLAVIVLAHRILGTAATPVILSLVALSAVLRYAARRPGRSPRPRGKGE
jgi:hypothetical protein